MTMKTLTENFRNCCPCSRFSVSSSIKNILCLLLINVAIHSTQGYDYSLHYDKNDRPLRILHIVTTLAEYNNGFRKTIKGQDRLQELIIPVLSKSVESMLTMPNWEVDVYLICGFTLKPERKQLVIDVLPDGVGLEVWDDATPIGYDRNDFNVIQPITRALARQHRFVLKDKLYHYDFFSIFEDDMVITKDHMTNFMEMSREIDRITNDAKPGNFNDPKDTSFFGPMTAKQLRRLVPGFIRVEVLKPGSETQEDPGPIPSDHDFSSYPGNLEHLDPNICCNIPKEYQPKEGLFPLNPKYDSLMIWETGIKGFAIRRIPLNSNLGWIALQPGPNKGLNPGERITGYWAGEGGFYGDESKPRSTDPQYFGQQGGFMASREQILRFEDMCPGAFLPPYDLPIYKDDGLFMMNVEYWSGGHQLFGDGNGACNLQRIISLNPETFSKQLLYHAANNKQLQINRKRQVNADHFLGQLNNVMKRAEKSIKNKEG